MSFGGAKGGDFKKILHYNKDRIFAFVLALGEVDDEKYAQAAGAINYGFPVIADTEWELHLCPVYSVQASPHLKRISIPLL